ncbi:hypothetical protein AM410_15950 [Enterobacter cloacae complex sp. FDA-CDC-AR_0164]|nr:hypothetical protein AM379_23040 [Enterobacter cloacae complex sp. FDA-CDC-AR_0132]AWC85834.1 hypothetical protein AM410_15950 [Enterobacter cloacae complex sp. FDA-CDC-AR_0164]KLR46027.1 hypothetical protein ABR23_09965 [Enterobacter ludwigii]RBO25025.1 hypothetical protein C2E44_01365 [Enterobacter ludwigii]
MAVRWQSIWGLDINHDLLIGFLLTFASSTDVQRKTWLSNGVRARENESLRKEQRNKNYIKMLMKKTILSYIMNREVLFSLIQ